MYYCIIITLDPCTSSVTEALTQCVEFASHPHLSVGVVSQDSILLHF